MRIGIDASNLRAGGGVTHLVELLRAVKPQEHGVRQVIVWGGASILSRLNDRPWLRKVHEPLLDRGLLSRRYWQRFKVGKLARDADCSLLFAPGGSYTGNFRPFVTMSQNMLPFEWDEARRYGISWQLLRHVLLRRSQSQSFRKADGLIFLTEYARDGVMKAVKRIDGTSIIIPHGVDARFAHPRRAQRDIGQYSGQRPFRILYVSVVEVYKHQWHVAEAVSQLWKAGLPVRLDLVGPAFPAALKRLRGSLDRLKVADNPIHYHGPIPHADLPRWYRDADLFVFASSCESNPIILLEAMASGLPIACSNRGPMPEILGDAGVFFDPEEPQEIASAIRSLVVSPSLRDEKAKLANRYAEAFSWQRCADETFRFLAQVVLSATDGRHARLFRERTVPCEVSGPPAGEALDRQKGSESSLYPEGGPIKGLSGAYALLLDAMACGEPFVSTDVRCVAELPGGVTVAHERDLAPTLCALRADSDHRAKLGSQGSAATRTEYHREIEIDTYNRLLRKDGS